MKIPKHITDLTGSDFAEIIRATNPKMGRGVHIEPKDDGFQFSIDESELKKMIWAFIRQGGTTAELNQLDNISMDPGDV